MTRTQTPSRTPTQQLRGFIDKFAPAHRTLIRAVRKAMRARLAGAYEMVYDNYNFFVIGYGATERPSEAILSIAASAKGVSLCFIQGARLPDPRKLLHGGGNQVRFLRIPSAAVLRKPAVRALISAAERGSKRPFTGGPTRLVLRMISAKQRPRRHPPAGA
jgi:hypothetical protein